MEFINANDLPAAGAMGTDNKVIVQQGDRFVLMTLAELLDYMASANVETDPTLTLEGVAAEALTTGKAVKAARAANLLDNSNFVRPINQRGSTSYNGVKGYTIDRWYTAGTSLNISFPNGCMEVVNTSASSRQFLRQATGITGAAGKTYTAAVYDSAAGAVVFSTVEIPETGANVEIATLTGGVLRIENDETKGIIFAIVVNSSSTVKASWVALYEGEYTAVTLPEYQPKGYAAELAECMRYYIKTRNGFGFINAAATIAYISVPLPAIMRTMPSVASYDMVSIRGAGKYVDTSAVTNVAISAGGPDDGPMAQLSITGNFADMKYNAVYYEGEICLSADL